MSDTFTKIDGRPFVWQDAAGSLHLGEGADVHPGVRLLWTACGKHDIPANAAWFRKGDPISCRECKNIEHERGMGAWHASQMAKPFADRNFE